MVLDAVSNFVRGTADAAIASGDTTISVADASIFPDPATDGEFNVVIWNASNFPRPDQDADVEIVRVTGRDTGADELTVVRGQEMTSASAHPDGSAIHLSPTAKMFSDIEGTFADFWDADAQQLTGDVNNTNTTTEALGARDLISGGTPWVDVRDVGAQPDDGNVFNELQQAADKAGEGGVIYIPGPGTYLTEYSTHWLLDGQTLLMNESAVLKADPSFTVPEEDTEDGTAIVAARPQDGQDRFENVSIVGGEIDGNKDEIDIEVGGNVDNVELVEYDETNNSRISETVMRNGPADAVDLDFVDNITVENTESYNCDGWGIHCSMETFNSTIKYNLVESCGFANDRGGIDQYGGPSGNAENNTFIANTTKECKRGLVLESRFATVKGHKSIGEPDNGIRITDRSTDGAAGQHNITGGIIRDCGANALTIESGVVGGTILNLTIDTTDLAGIRDLGSTGIKIDNCNIQNTVQQGVRSAGTQSNINGTTFDDIGFSSIILESDSEDCFAVYNQLDSAGDIVDEGTNNDTTPNKP